MDDLPSRYEKASIDGSFFYAVVTVIALLVSVLTLASFIKVAQSVFFGQLAPKCEQAKEVPVSMRLPMWIMAGFCLLTGILPGLVNRFLIVPATAATLNITGYIDAMMGTGYAQMLAVCLVVSWTCAIIWQDTGTLLRGCFCYHLDGGYPDRCGGRPWIPRSGLPGRCLYRP